MAQFQRGLTLVLVALAGLIGVLELISNHADPDLVVLAPALAAVAAAAARLVPAFLASRSG